MPENLRLALGMMWKRWPSCAYQRCSGIEIILSTLTVGPCVDWYLAYQWQKGEESTECRLPPMVTGSAFIPLGLLSFEWNEQYEVHWAAPIFFTSLVGYGIVSIAISSWSYLVEHALVWTTAREVFPQNHIDVIVHIGEGGTIKARAWSPCAPESNNEHVRYVRDSAANVEGSSGE
jgi:hypothetical protein